jgi:hypothetical protein
MSLRNLAGSTFLGREIFNYFRRMAPSYLDQAAARGGFADVSVGPRAVDRADCGAVGGAMRLGQQACYRRCQSCVIPIPCKNKEFRRFNLTKW